jgi:hypothetical protein
MSPLVIGAVGIAFVWMSGYKLGRHLESRDWTMRAGTALPKLVNGRCYFVDVPAPDLTTEEMRRV